MKNKWIWGLGIGLVLVMLLILPSIWSLFLPDSGYGMMDNSYGWHMPMMYGGYGMMGIGVLFMWLPSLILLALVGLGIAWLVKALVVPNKQQVQRAKESGSPETPEILYTGKEG